MLRYARYSKLQVWYYSRLLCSGRQIGRNNKARIFRDDKLFIGNLASLRYQMMLRSGCRI